MLQVERLTCPYIIETDNISCEIGGKPILHNISFKVPAGSFCCLLGKSGCGKTTLFRALSGLNEVQNGGIKINGKVIVKDAFSYVPSHQRKVGLVFQDYTLFPHLSVRDNLLFGAPKCSGLEQQQIIDHLLNLVDLEGYEEHYPHELSGGQQQRIALARTLASDPLLVLLDEPFSNLEQDQRSGLAEQVKTILRKQSVSALLVTHDQTEAFSFADYIGVMMDGELVQWGTPEDIYYRPKNEKIAEFIGSGHWYDCQVVEDKEGAKQLATPFGFISLAANEQLLSEQSAQLLQHSRDLQIFLRQENIYLPINQEQCTQKHMADVECQPHVQLNFPVINQWRIVDKQFSGFLTFLTLQAIEDKHGLFPDFPPIEISVFVRSNREIQLGQKVQVELELGSFILRVKP